MTKTQAQNQILITKVNNHCFDPADEEYMRQWFGKRYISNGMVRCNFCDTNAVPFKGYIENHVCQDCLEELKKLEKAIF